jgi:serine/threonine protein kinase/WD40 repeat protein
VTPEASRPPGESDVDPIDDLAEDFVARYRRGERPSPQEYAARYPALADRIRDLFPALVELEEIGSAVENQTADLPRARLPAHPERVGEYRILRKVGAGGMGVVYEAVQETLGRHVALKVLPPGRGEAYLDRFRREARTAARLHHTNIVPVFGVGEADGVHFYAMQYIHGHPLDLVLGEVRVLRSTAPVGPPSLTQSVARGLQADSFEPPDAPAGPPSSRLAGPAGARYYRGVARLGVQAADGLAYAHAQGVLHRDVKPSNLLLDTQGTLWITDFGLAKADDSDDLTRTGDLVGTLRYMAPERFAGHADARSDVYALGATLYELLALRPAFDDTDRLRLLDRIGREDPPPPRRHDPRIPRDLETIVLKAMARSAAGRYPSAAAMAEDLRRFLADRPVKARRTSPAEVAWRWVRRNPVVASLLAAVACLLVALAAGGQLAAARLKRERDDATERLFEAELNRARANRFSRQIGQRYDTLGAAARAALIRRDERLRDEATAALALPDLRFGAGLPNLRAADLATQTLAPSEDSVALLDAGGSVRLVRLADRHDLWRVEAAGVGYLRFSPDGRYVAGVGGGMIHRVWRTADGTAALDRPVGADAFAFHPNARRLAVGRGNQVTLHDLEGGAADPPWRAAGPIRMLAYSPDGGRLAVGYWAAVAVTVHDPATGRVTERVPVNRAGHVVAWHPDGRRLAVGGEDGRTEVWDVGTGRRLVVLVGHVQVVTDVSFHPGGELVATSSWDGVLRLWHPATGRQLLQLTAGVSQPHFSPDGSRLGYVTRGDTVQRLEVAESREYRTFVGRPGAGDGAYRAGAVTPDGRLLALAADDGVRLWDLSAGRELAYLPGMAYSVHLLPAVGPGATGVELVAGGPGVWRRWPLWPDPLGDGRRLALGPPRALPLRQGPGRGAVSRDGRLLAACYDRVECDVLDRATGTVRPLRGGHPAAGHVAISPDGRRVATSGWHTEEVRVWDAATGERLHTLTPGHQASVFFSADSRSLITSRGDGYQFWGAEDVRPGRWLPRDVAGYPGHVAFTPDGRLMALELTPGVISLLDAETLHPIARLADPDGHRATWLGFTPDGTRLLAVAHYDKAVHVWDLRLIRERLAGIGLDWEWPPFPPTDPTPTDPIEVRVVPSWASLLLPAPARK